MPGQVVKRTTERTAQEISKQSIKQVSKATETASDYIPSAAIKATNNSPKIERFILEKPVKFSKVRRLNNKDVAVNKYKLGEAIGGAQLEEYLGARLRRAKKEDGDVDFVVMEGSHEGKTVDFMFTVNSKKEKEKNE